MVFFNCFPFIPRITMLISAVTSIAVPTALKIFKVNVAPYGSFSATSGAAFSTKLCSPGISKINFPI